MPPIETASGSSTTMTPQPAAAQRSTAGQRVRDGHGHVEAGRVELGAGLGLLAGLARPEERFRDRATAEGVRARDRLGDRCPLGSQGSRRTPRGEERPLGLEAAVEEGQPHGLGQARPAHRAVGVQEVDADLGLDGEDLGDQLLGGPLERGSVGASLGHIGLEHSEVNPVGGHAGPGPCSMANTCM